MTISAKIIEDSISDANIRLTTIQLMYPRFIHAEFMTHRVFSRNASSSRAIPVAKMLEMVRKEPAMPIHWGANRPGMQAKEQLTGDALTEAKNAWLSAAQLAVESSEKMQKLGLHKQVANRVTEPFQHISVVVTATEWTNFFGLRCHPDAQPEIEALANQMLLAMQFSKPKKLRKGEWHLPYVTEEERAGIFKDDLPKISGARCARVSYLTHDGENPSLEKDLQLYKALVGSEPLHASPIEHAATPDDFVHLGNKIVWEKPEYHGNLKGWIQFRKLVESSLV